MGSTLGLPLLIFKARERDRQARSLAKKRCQNYCPYINADVEMKKPLLQQADNKMMQSRTQNGVFFEAIAISLRKEEAALAASR